MILYMYIALRQGQKIPWGQTFDIFLPVFIHVYSPRAGADNSPGVRIFILNLLSLWSFAVSFFH